jgi:cyclopropane-fatty-acyl-phospholipid synthase
MLLHSIVSLDLIDFEQAGITLTHESVKFIKFIAKRIFPGGQLRAARKVIRYAEEAGFTLTRTQSLQPHYARTLDCWAASLQARRDEAIAITSQEIYDTYMYYLTGCAKCFHGREVDVVQFSLRKP